MRTTITPKVAATRPNARAQSGKSITAIAPGIEALWRKSIAPANIAPRFSATLDSKAPALLLPLGVAARPAVRDELRAARLERAIGVIYRPETELQSHYFQAVLPAQFDEYIWFDETEAVRALPAVAREGLPDTYPFGV